MTERPFPTDLAAANREIEDLRADRKALAYQVDKTISELDSAEKEIGRLRALNAELLEALEDLLDTIPRLTDENAMVFHKVRAVIAKAKEKRP